MNSINKVISSWRAKIFNNSKVRKIVEKKPKKLASNYAYRLGVAESNRCETVLAEFYERLKAAKRTGQCDFSFLDFKDLQNSLNQRSSYFPVLPLAEFNLERANFFKANCAEYSFHDYNFKEANFRGADLFKVKFFDSCLEKAQLTSANLEKAVFRQSNLEQASLVNAYAKKSDFIGVDLANTDLSGANLIEAKFYNDPLDTKKYKFESSNFNNTNLTSALFYNLSIKKVSFNKADMTGAKFLDIKDLYSSCFGKANLNQAEIKNVKGRCVDFTEANLSKSLLENVSFESAEMHKTDLSYSCMVKVSLKNSDLREADFRGAELSNVDFTGADLTGADFTGAKIENINLEDVKGLDQVIGLDTVS